MSSATSVTDSTFKQEVLESEIPVLVDFWAPWCGPCRMVAPIVDEVAEQYTGKVKVVKVNTDESPSVASEYGIRSIPTLMVFKGGSESIWLWALFLKQLWRTHWRSTYKVIGGEGVKSGIMNVAYLFAFIVPTSSSSHPLLLSQIKMADHSPDVSDKALRDSLRRLPIFSQLQDEQFGFVAKGNELWLRPGEIFVAEGDPHGDFYVLVAGGVEFTKKIGDQDVHVVSFESGMFFGHEPILLDIPVPVTGRTVCASHLFKLEENAFWYMLSTCSSITRELLRTIAQRLQNLESVSQHHGKLIALGTLSAGLAHELNNPAAAVSRNARNLEDIFQGLSALALKLNQQQLTSDQRSFLADLQQEAIERVKTMPQLDPLTQSDQEDEVTAWLEERGVTNGWQLAPTLVGAGLDTEWLDTVVERIPTSSLSDVLAWLEVTLTGVGLLDEIKNGSSRISELVKAIKEYSYMDQAPLQEVDVHDGLESTLTILGHKLKQGVVVTREYDRSLPKISAYGSELNQVWTILIDNAIDATNGQGHLWVRTSREGDRIVVEIADDGAGIPLEMQSRIFEQFFTTKDVGKGTGLGLDLARRIVVGRQRGDIRVFSQSGDTRFQVRLPVATSKQ